MRLLQRYVKQLWDRLPAARADKLDNLDTTVSSRLDSVDSRLNNLNAAISSRIATNDARLDDLDATVSSRIASNDAKLDNLDANITGIIATNDARLNHLDLDISDLVPTVKNIQTGYTDPTESSGSGEDVKYIDITITAVSDITKCFVLIQRVSSTVGLTGRLINTTTLRISTTSSVVRGRWIVLEFN